MSRRGQFGFLSLTFCSEGSYPLAKVKIAGIQLKAEISDNSEGLESWPEPESRDAESVYAEEKHMPGYNGISRLWIDKKVANPFVPLFSGLNCEAFFDGSGFSLEPRWVNGDRKAAPAPSKVESLSSSSARLIIEQGNQFIVRCEVVFAIEEPGSIDISIEVTPFRSDYEGGYVGVLWPNYMDRPTDQQAYVPVRDAETGQIRWKGCFEASNGGGCVYQLEDTARRFSTPQGEGAYHPAIYSVSKDGLMCPVFFGRLKGHLFAMMLDPPESVRLCFNPNGGGPGCPAWDFQTMIVEPKPRETHRFRGRMIFGPLALSRSLLEKYRAWSGRDVTATVPSVPKELTEKIRNQG